MKHQKIYLILLKILILKYYYVKIRNLNCYYILYFDLLSSKTICIIVKNTIFLGVIIVENGIIVKEL